MSYVISSQSHARKTKSSSTNKLQPPIQYPVAVPPRFFSIPLYDPSLTKSRFFSGIRSEYPPCWYVIYFYAGSIMMPPRGLRDRNLVKNTLTLPHWGLIWLWSRSWPHSMLSLVWDHVTHRFRGGNFEGLLFLILCGCLLLKGCKVCVIGFQKTICKMKKKK